MRKLLNNRYVVFVVPKGEHLFFSYNCVGVHGGKNRNSILFGKTFFFFFKSTVPLKTAKKGSGTIGDAVRQSAISLS